jgi:hypothetical protein
MRRYRLFSLVLAAGAGGILLAGAGASASPSGKTTVLRYFGKQTSSAFTTSTGAPVPTNAPPVAGDQLFDTVNLYAGTAKHHAKTWTASASLDCTVLSASKTSIPAACEGVVAIGGSMLVSLSTQNFAGTPSLYPITGGTGIYFHAKGSVKTKSVGKTNNSNVIITITR